MTLKGLNLFSSKFTSSRSSVTCTYKCGNACFGECENKSDNPYFGDMMSRRSALKAGSLTVLTVGGGAAMASLAPAAAAAPFGSSALPGSSSRNATPASVKGMQFAPVAPNERDEVVIPAGYQQSVLIAWGDPVIEGAEEFDIDNQTAAQAEKQFGFNNDFAGLLDHPTNPDRMVYVASHEYTTEPHMHPGYDSDNPTEEQVKIGWANHGLTVLEVSKDARTGELRREFGDLNRRITATSPFKLVGPAAGSEYVKTSADPEGLTVLGTLNNCAGGVTPWGTILSGEENFDQYFAHSASVTDERVKTSLDRLGIPKGESGRKWERFDARFDVSQHPNEVNRFGYIVELNPFDATSTPVKHTALGRFKHEAGNIHVTGDGTVVCYSGDDARFEYLYKFVSSRKMIDGDIDHNLTILDHGTLYVAVMEGNSPQHEFDGSGLLPSDGAFDGSGRWEPLLSVDEKGKAKSHVEGFSAEEVAIFTREAADAKGATKMDRPEDVEASPVTGKVYMALTNNKYRGAAEESHRQNWEDVTEYAPVKENKNGLVMELDDEHAGTSFTWNLILVCGEPEEAYTYFGGFDKTKVSPISCPDNLAFDEYGNLWISTDGNALGSNDGLYALTVEGPNRGELKCFLTVPYAAETCGPIVDKQRVIVNVQHPGETDDASVANPASNWPEGGNSNPRPAAVVVWKANGGEIGVE